MVLDLPFFDTSGLKQFKRFFGTDFETSARLESPGQVENHALLTGLERILGGKMSLIACKQAPT
jgi:hypothetical protein